MTSMTRCENNLEAHIYFWNVTNPSQVLAGTHGPALREVGPYVLNNTINKRQNITFSNDDTEVSFISTLSRRRTSRSSRDRCALADEVCLRKSHVYSMRLTVELRRLFLSTWRTSAWFERLVARRTFSPRASATIAARRRNHATLRRPRERSKDRRCVSTHCRRRTNRRRIVARARLGTDIHRESSRWISVTQLGNFEFPPRFAAFQHVPEYAIWAAAEASQPVTTVSIGAPVSNSIYSAMTSHTTGMTASGNVDDGADVGDDVYDSGVPSTALERLSQSPHDDVRSGRVHTNARPRPRPAIQWNLNQENRQRLDLWILRSRGISSVSGGRPSEIHSIGHEDSQREHD